ncbi:cytochrome c3 family protein [Geothrix sp. 21YS21S-4]|uniref:cytochrome c3 family protein n=1 Tax=Geothrix sp. 21YS21S-4 TaxID=3068889 RepID=UPI0027B96E4B|nr:cytochrome c3 family protein [Geothrix sp. 21YS21S-4]
MPTSLFHRFRTATRLLLFAAMIPLGLAAAQPATFTADLHKAKGVSCADCHGNGKKKTFVPAERCLGCHGPEADLAKKTAEVKPENPHASPHWGSRMECNVCHRQHEKTVNWCNHCHAFNFQVP